MKKNKLLFALIVLTCFLSNNKANAQITGISLSAASLDSLIHPCAPSDLNAFFYGSVTGSPSSTDSITAKLVYGDGTDTTFKLPISSSKTFTALLYAVHTYMSSGMYTSKVIVEAPGGFKDSLSSSPFFLAASCSITSLTLNKTSSVLDSLIGYCPRNKLYFELKGSVAGTIAKYDSLQVHINFGDGTDTTYKVPLIFPSFNIKSTFNHSYTSAGTYTAKYIITTPSGLKDSFTTSSIAVVTGGISATKVSSYPYMDSIRCILPIAMHYKINGIAFGCTSSIDTVTLNINFGDGTDTTVKTILDSILLYTTSLLHHNYSTAGTFSPRIIATVKSSGVKDTFYISSFTLTDTCAVLKGTLFVDDNADCSKSTSENGIWYTIVRAINTSTSDTSYSRFISDTSGKYSMVLAPGTYNITPLVNRLYSPVWGVSSTHGDTLKATCPSSGSSSVTVVSKGTYTKDFAYECTPIDTFDASCLASSNCYKPGDTSVMNVWAGDWWRVYYYNCISLSTTFTLTLDSRLTYAGHLNGKAPASVVGKTITWNLSGADIALFNSRIKVAVATSATIGDTLSSTAYIAPSTSVTDPITSNNTFIYSREVVSSFDPNMKEVAPRGNGPQGYIAKNTPMTYTIHFQNTGTASATNITIVDTLASNLEANSLHLISSTHNVIVYQDGSLVKFRFNNINLPDSNSDYYGSMGSVTYGILPKRDLPGGTKITNKAGIYFDYNAPIVTNTTLNTIENSIKIEELNTNGTNYKVYPNPTHTLLNVQTDNTTNIFETVLIDVLGRVVNTQKSQNGKVEMNTNQLINGIYFLKITKNGVIQENVKIQVLHP